jgi:hypothetical protein
MAGGIIMPGGGAPYMPGTCPVSGGGTMPIPGIGGAPGAGTARPSGWRRAALRDHRHDRFAPKEHQPQGSPLVTEPTAGWDCPPGGLLRLLPGDAELLAVRDDEVQVLVEGKQLTQHHPPVRQRYPDAAVHHLHQLARFRHPICWV